MHRRFIALVLSASLAITTIGAAPAHADDRDKWIAGAVGLAILGLALNEEKKKKRKRRAQQQYYYNQGQQYNGHNGHNGHNGYNNHAYSGTHGHAGPIIHQPKPRTKVKPRLLPRNCRVTGKINGHDVRGLAIGCLKRNSVNVKALPQHCKIKVRNPYNGKRKMIFGKRCLREQGYRVARAH